MAKKAQPVKKSLIRRGRETIPTILNLLRIEIWHTKNLEECGLRAKLFGLLRLMTITSEGISRNRIPSQAAALSYDTLIALGPLIAIIIMASSFVVKDNQEQVAIEALTKLVYFVAPSAEEASKQEVSALATESNELSDPNWNPETEGPTPKTINPQVSTFIQGIVQNTRSGTVGVIGTLILIAISIQLLSTIEKTFNTIWGVRQSRNLAQQILFYWTFISLGTVISFTVLTLGTVSAIAQGFEELPFFGKLFKDGFISFAPTFAFLLVTLLLTGFNRFIPNTQVRCAPALLGAIISATLLHLNQSLSFLYIGFVIRQQSLFGAVGVLPILLFGLFVFWVVLLLGGQLTYAIQNRNALTNQRVWENVSVRTREALSLTTLILIARRFQDCGAPYPATELSTKMRVPGNILNETLTRLCDLGYLSPVASTSKPQEGASRYQPAMPLETITLATFKEHSETWGNNDGSELIQSIDPILPYYHQHLLHYDQDVDARVPLTELLKRLKTEPSNKL